MMPTKMTQRIHIEYYQGSGASEISDIRYSVDIETDTYNRALDVLTNIMNTCRGVITSTIIEKIEA